MDKSVYFITKLNINNDSVRIKKRDVEKMIEEKVINDSIRRMAQGEYQAKLAIRLDLVKEKNSENRSSRILNYDDSKFCYPQDFYIELGEVKVLINVVTLDYNVLKKFKKETLEKRFERNFNASSLSLKLIVLFVGFNDDLPEEYFEFRPDEVVNMLTVNLKDINNLNIMNYINLY